MVSGISRMRVECKFWPRIIGVFVEIAILAGWCVRVLRRVSENAGVIDFL